MESEEFEDESVLDVEIEQLDQDLDQGPKVPTIAMLSLPITGEPRVDDELARLNEIPNLPVHEHVAVFEDVQRRLHETLADLSNQ